MSWVMRMGLARVKKNKGKKKKKFYINNVYGELNVRVKCCDLSKGISKAILIHLYL